jgi:hypothetical protein
MISAVRREHPNQPLNDGARLLLPPLLALGVPVALALRHNLNKGEQR